MTQIQSTNQMVAAYNAKDEDLILQQTSILLPISILINASTNRPLKPKRIKELLVSIPANGLKHPITVNEYGLIIEGHHRVQVYKELGYEAIEANVRAGLTEDDVADFNNDQETWSLEGYLHSRKNLWAAEYNSVGLPANVVIIAMGYTRTKVKEATIVPTEEQFERFEYIKDNIWIPIYEKVTKTPNSVKAMRSTPICLWKFAAVEGVNNERLVSQVVKEWVEINRYGKVPDIMQAIANAYNKNLRANSEIKPIHVDHKGKIVK